MYLFPFHLTTGCSSINHIGYGLNSIRDQTDNTQSEENNILSLWKILNIFPPNTLAIFPVFAAALYDIQAVILAIFICTMPA